MPRILIAGSLIVAAIFAGILTGRAFRSEPRQAHGKPLFQKPGSMNWRQPPLSAPGGAATWKIVKDIDDSNDVHDDLVLALTPDLLMKAPN